MASNLAEHFSNSVNKTLSDILLVEEQSTMEEQVPCEECGSSGFIYVKRSEKPGDIYASQCKSCKEKRVLAIRRSKLNNIPSHLRKYPVKFDVPVNMSVLNSEWEIVKTLRDNSEIEKKLNAGIFSLLDKGTGMYLFGNQGSGKTMVACSIAVKYVESGKNVAFCLAPELFDMAFQAGNSEGPYRQIFSADLLIIDDFGAEFQDSKGFKASFLQKLLITRASRRKPTVITSCLVVPKALEDCYGKKLASAIISNFIFLQLSSKENFNQHMTSKVIEDFMMDDTEGDNNTNG